MGKSKRREHSSVQQRKYTSLQHMEKKKIKQERALEPNSSTLQWWSIVNMEAFNLPSKLSQMAKE
jgi:hypothetical protein